MILAWASPFKEGSFVVCVFFNHPHYTSVNRRLVDTLLGEFSFVHTLNISSRHKTLNQGCLNVGPPSQALDQRKANIDSTSCVCWYMCMH